MKTSLSFLIVLLTACSLFSQDLSADKNLEVIRQLTSAISKDVNNLSLYYQRADVYSAINDFERANSDFKRVLELYSGQSGTDAEVYAKSCYRLADYHHFRNSNHTEALKYVSNGLKVDGSNKDLEIMQAIILAANPAKSEAALEKYADLSAKYPDDVRLNLYHAKFLRNSNPLAAAALYERVLAVDPSNKQALSGAGAIYNNEATKLSSGVVSDPQLVYDYAQKAALFFEKLHKLNPSDQEVANVLIAIYNELNEQDKAKQLKPSAPY